MESPNGLVAELADAILDGNPIDWASAETCADDAERSLLDPFRLLADLADVHRRSPLRESSEPITDLRGATVGMYRLIELLGQGGMGEVYLGERVDGRFEQTVAVKLVKRGMDSVEILRRFARERRILARLEHPGIARLLDGGETSDGRPYFVMERVEREPITEYCSTRALSLEDRLRLFAVCCDAVDAAHRGLVVHRDLKPSNILVTADGQVKLLDFGIARLLAEEDDVLITSLGGRVITPAYAAPEQILGGGLTIATDVFALGVVLYELLTGTRPYDRRAATPHELATRVERETAERPSIAVKRTNASNGLGGKRQRWERRLRGDLDTITMKALAREQNRRYLSAAALADDVRRYLTSRPVEAQPDSGGYRLRKFVTRHRLGVAATAAVTAAVLTALFVSLAQATAARRQAERAAAAQAYLVSLFDQLDPVNYSGTAPTVRGLVERGSERLDRELEQQPELRAEMQVILGRVFGQLSLAKQGEAQFRRAFETYRGLFGADDLRTAKAQKGLAVSLARQARYAESEPMFQELLEHKAVRADTHEMGSVLLDYGNQKRLTGDYAAAEVLLTRAVALLERSDTGRSLGSALNNLGLTYWRQGREREGITLLERVLAIRLKDDGPQSNVVGATKYNLSLLNYDAGQFDLAERYAAEALEVAEKLFPTGHAVTGTRLAALGHAVQKRGDIVKARSLYQRSIASFEGSIRPDDPDISFPIRYLAGLMLDEGNPKGAVLLYERALAIRRKGFGERHHYVGESWGDLSRGRLAAGDTAGALVAIQTGVDTLRSALPESPQLAGGLVLLGQVLSRSGRPHEAVPYLEEAQTIFRSKPPKDSKDLADLESLLAAARSASR